MKFSKSLLLLPLLLVGCGTVNVNDPLSNLPQSARDRIDMAMPKPVYKRDRPVETIRSSPANQPPAQTPKTGIINGSHGKMNCRQVPGGLVVGQYINGSEITIDSQIVDQYGIWYHDAKHNCYIHENGVNLK